MNQKGKTIFALAALAAASIHILNRVEYTRSTVKNILGCAANNYYEWRFGKIRYTRKGSGSPVILLHDMTLGSSSYEFHKIIDSLSVRHEVYSIDLLGYGLSDKPNMMYTNYLYVQLVTDFIKNVIGKRTSIIATGDSAPVAIMACHNDSEIIQDVIAINPQSLFQLNQIPSRQTKILKLLLETPILGTFIYNLHASRTKLTEVFQKEYFYNPINVEEKDVSSYVEASHIPDHRSKYVYTSYVGKYMNANIIHALKEINNNIYLIAGRDKEGNSTIVDNYVYYNNAIESVFIDRTRQLPHMERPEEVLKYLDVFLN